MGCQVSKEGYTNFGQTSMYSKENFVMLPNFASLLEDLTTHITMNYLNKSVTSQLD
jgi:hypothetical protein